jgi:hypothetical protein
MGIFDIFKSKNKNKLPKNLVFKSNDGVYEYIQKFFSDVDVVPKQAIFGRVFKINKSKKPYICIVTLPNCLVNNKTETIVGIGPIHDQVNQEISEGDIVYFGIEEVKNITLRNDFLKIKPDLLEIMSNMTSGVVLAKVKPELNTETMAFELYD